MTALRTLTLSHFRSHRLTRLSPAGRSVVLYGPNGAGKTNVLEAVSMLSPGRGLRRAASAEMIRFPEGVGWKVTGDLDAHQIETWVENGTTRGVRIDGKAAPQTALGRHLAIVWLTPAMDRLWTEGAEGRRRFLDRIAMSFHPGHGDASLAYEKSMRERNRLLKDQVHDPHWYRALENRMAEAGAAIELARDDAIERLATAQADAKTAFPRAGLQLTGAEGRERIVSTDGLAEAFAQGRSSDMAAGRTLSGPHRTDLNATYVDKQIPARAASTGEQKALLISLVLASARALRDHAPGPPILLLDEVAAHLDQDRRSALFREIEQLGAQAWMTGTGAELFDDVGGATTSFEVSDGTDGSEVSER